MSFRSCRSPQRPPCLLPALLCAAAAAALVGCAQPGLPLPPSLKIPVPAADLSGARAGNAVTLRWTTPRRATDNVLLTGAQHAVVCRSLDPAPCQPVGTLLVAPGAPATYTDTLPPQLAGGPPRLLVYKVLLTGHHGHDAGPSNPVYTAAGAAPAPIEQLSAEATAAGILLRWQPTPATAEPAAQPGCVVRINRTRILAAGEQPSDSHDSSQGVPQPLEQTLEVARGCALTHATDHDALLNRTYRYTAVRVERLTLASHSIEIVSSASAPAGLQARDVFPPAIPSGLQAVADPEARAIDLSWTPGAEPDLAGYHVYRRVASSQAAPERVSGAEPVPDAGWRDPHPTPGTAYAYSVSAVDTSGNESPRSAETTETLRLPEPQ